MNPAKPESPSETPPPPGANSSWTVAADERLFLRVIFVGVAIIALITLIVTIGNRPSPATAGTGIQDEFSLVERSGRAVTRADLLDQYVVANFVFTSCSTKCLAVLDRMANVQRLAADAPDVRLLSLTIDPRTDSPEALAKFANRFGADPNRWLFLTGDKAELDRLTQSILGPNSEAMADFTHLGFANTTQIVLINPQGQACASFNGMDPTVASTIVAEIRRRRSQL